MKAKQIFYSHHFYWLIFFSAYFFLTYFGLALDSAYKVSSLNDFFNIVFYGLSTIFRTLSVFFGGIVFFIYFYFIQTIYSQSRNKNLIKLLLVTNLYFIFLLYNSHFVSYFYNFLFYLRVGHLLLALVLIDLVFDRKAYLLN